MLLIGKDTYDRELDGYFSSFSVDIIRQNVFTDLKYNSSLQKVPKNLLFDLITIGDELNCRVLTKFNAVKRILNLITDDMDTILIRLLLCFKALVEVLPADEQQKKPKEYELCTRYLQPFFQTLFDSDEDNGMVFKWINTITFQDKRDDGNPAATKNRPDGCVENDRKTIGFIEVKTIESSTNHRKINADLYRLGLFGKTALSHYGLKKTSSKCCMVISIVYYLTQDKSI